MTAKERVDHLTEEQVREILVRIIEWTKVSHYVPWEIGRILGGWLFFGMMPGGESDEDPDPAEEGRWKGTQLDRLRELFDELGVGYHFLDPEDPSIRYPAGRCIMGEKEINDGLKILRVCEGKELGGFFADFCFSSDGHFHSHYAAY